MDCTKRSIRIHILTCLFLLCTLIMGGCGSPDSDMQDTFHGVTCDNTITFYADVTHDGKEDKILIDVNDILSDDQIPATVNVYGQEDHVIWTGEVGIPHMGWGYYYLAAYKGKDYILFYLPDESQGDIYYTFRLFHFDSEGKQILDDEYKISYKTAEQWEGDLEKFEKRLEEYLENSVLLVGVFDFSLEYYTEETDMQ